MMARRQTSLNPLIRKPETTFAADKQATTAKKHAQKSDNGGHVRHDMEPKAGKNIDDGVDDALGRVIKLMLLYWPVWKDSF